ncbi:hypothetical protein [Bosea sp. Root381]|uniref:hypothetical protein n=1 Tax=Bosea sp. Root381 TaxID=1736524 RepID=UPI000A4802FA|nr:hypothetical protein [Bosea sp. Root381]
MNDIPTDLFAWADRPQTVVDFRARRETLPRYERLHPLRHYDIAVARMERRIPPAPILRFPAIHPASPGSYTGGPLEVARR